MNFARLNSCDLRFSEVKECPLVSSLIEIADFSVPLLQELREIFG